MFPFLLALMLFTAGPAMASTVVDASPVVLWLKPWIDAAASTIVMTVVGFVGIWARRWFGLEGEARMREALHSALMTAAGAAISTLTETAARKLSRIEIESEMVGQAVSYVLRATPDAVRFFGLTDDRIAEMVRSKIIQLLPMNEILPKA